MSQKKNQSVKITHTVLISYFGGQIFTIKGISESSLDSFVEASLLIMIDSVYFLLKLQLRSTHIYQRWFCHAMKRFELETRFLGPSLYK